MSKILDTFDKCLKKSQAEQTELVYEKEEFFLTRFAESVIHQNIGRNDHTIWCRAIVDNKIGIAQTNIATEESIDQLIQSAVEICSRLEADPDFVSLPAASKTKKSNGYYKSTAEYSADARAMAVKEIVENAEKAKLEASGMFQTSAIEIAVVNSLGIRTDDRVTEARLSMSLSGNNDRAGFAQGFSRNVNDLNFSKLADRAVRKAERKTEPVKLDPGEYTVILDPEAVADFLLFLGFLGFGGKGMVSGRSFMARSLEQQIMAPFITITEDPAHDSMQYMSFDYEGVPRKQVQIVENGIAKGVVYNSYLANLKGVESTGNALPPNNNYGPYPKAMVMAPGEKSIQEIIESTEHGIYVTHFWYLNFVNPMITSVTGTTRDGTFLIKDGKISAPINDMRINQSMLEAFNNAEMISSERRVVPKYGVLMNVPAMKTTNFNFVSSE